MLLLLKLIINYTDMYSLDNPNTYEIIDNENNSEDKLRTLETKHALEILKIFDKYNESDIDLAYNSENNSYLFINNGDVISDFFTLGQLEKIEGILQVYYEHQFNPEYNKFEINIEKRKMTTGEAKENILKTKGKTVMWLQPEHFKDVYDKSIIITHSDERSLLNDLFNNNLTVLDDKVDSDLDLYTNFLNNFIVLK